MSVVANVEDFAQEHPIATVGIGVGTVVILFWLLSGSGTPAATVVAAPADNTSAAAALAANQANADASTAQAKIAADAATTQANIAAGVANTATAAGEAVAISNNNTTAHIADQQFTTAQLANGNQTLAGEFASVANLLAIFSNNATSVTNNAVNAEAGSYQTIVNDQAAINNNAINATLGGGIIDASPYGGGGSTGNAGNSGPLSQLGAAQLSQIVDTNPANGIGQTVASAEVNAGGAYLPSGIQNLLSQIGQGIHFHANNG